MTPAQFTTLVTGLPEADLGLPGVRPGCPYRVMIGAFVELERARVRRG